MAPSPESFLLSLRGVSEFEEQYTIVEELAAAGSVAELEALAHALEEIEDAEVLSWVREAIFDLALRALALCPRPEAALAAMRLALRPRKRSVQDLRRRSVSQQSRLCATLLASAHPVDTLHHAIANDDAIATELVACWIQELVVREHDLRNDARVRGFWTMLAKNSHELAQLPLKLCDAELLLSSWLRDEGVRGSSWSTPFGRSISSDDNTCAPLAPVIEFEERAASPRLPAALSDWLANSNGAAEARHFALRQPLRASEVGIPTLRALPLHCLRNAESHGITLSRVPLSRVTEQLFAAAATGGAYSRGAGAGYGRLWLWQSIAGLMAVEDQLVATLAREASEWHWFDFLVSREFTGYVEGAWFCGANFDIGIMALSPAGDRVSVLAATDTD